MLKHRGAHIDDLQQIYNLYMDEEANPFLTFDPMSLEMFTPVFKSMLSDNTLLVCEHDTSLVATYRLLQKTHRQAHIWYLGGFTVSRLFQGKGFGSEILEYVKRSAVNENIKRIELTVDTRNENAINLYRKVGFEIEGTLRNNFKLSSTGQYYDEYIMALLIN
jgi:RimJ/RimL family protein N-acetyltransferase